MNIVNLIGIALQALYRNKIRSFLTMLGIIIGVASVIAMLAIGEGSKKSIQEQVSGMGTNMITVIPGAQRRHGVSMGREGAQSLTFNDMYEIEKNSNSIMYLSPEVRAGGQVIFGTENEPSTIYGVNLDYLEIKKFTISSGRMFSEREILTSAKVCVIGKTVYDNIFGETNVDPIGKTIRFNNIPMIVIGVLNPKGLSTFGHDQDDILIAPYTTVQKRILAITHLHAIVVSAISEKHSAQVVEDIENTLRMTHRISKNDEDDFRIRSQEELIKSFTSISDVLTVLLAVIASISLLVGGIGIMNIMYVSVTERVREIGLRMAIGGKSRDILLQFLIEALLLSMIGGLLGIALGIGSTKLVHIFMQWPVYIQTEAVLLSFIICTAIGIFFGWYPAQKAAKLDPIDALRYE